MGGGGTLEMQLRNIEHDTRVFSIWPKNRLAAPTRAYPSADPTQQSEPQARVLEKNFACGAPRWGFRKWDIARVLWGELDAPRFNLTVKVFKSLGRNEEKSPRIIIRVLSSVYLLAFGRRLG